MSVGNSRNIYRQVSKFTSGVNYPFAKVKGGNEKQAAGENRISQDVLLPILISRVECPIVVTEYSPVGSISEYGITDSGESMIFADL